METGDHDNQRKNKQAPGELEGPDQKRLKRDSQDKRTIYVFFGDCKLPIAFYPGTKTNELVALILKGLRLPQLPEAATFLDEEGHLFALSSYMPDGASVFLQYEPSNAMTRPTSNAMHIDTVTDRSAATTTGTLATTISTVREQAPGTDPTTLLACAYWLLVHQKQPLIPECTSLLLCTLYNLYASETQCSWNLAQSCNVRAIDLLLHRRIASVGDWPYRCTSLGGIAHQQPDVCVWRVQFAGLSNQSLCGYFHLGLVFDDERGLVEGNPRSTLVPCIPQPSQSRCYDVILDMRTPQRLAMHMVDVPGRHLYRCLLNPHKLPSPNNPLNLVLWSKHRLQAQIVHYRSLAAGDDVASCLSTMTARPLMWRAYSHDHTTIQDECS